MQWENLIFLIFLEKICIVCFFQLEKNQIKFKIPKICPIGCALNRKIGVKWDPIGKFDFFIFLEKNIHSVLSLSQQKQKKIKNSKYLANRVCTKSDNRSQKCLSRFSCTGHFLEIIFISKVIITYTYMMLAFLNHVNNCNINFSIQWTTYFENF